MKEGLLSSTVKTAEEMLEAIGYNPGEVDGLFDKDTEEAVIKLQKDLELKLQGFLSVIRLLV